MAKGNLLHAKAQELNISSNKKLSSSYSLMDAQLDGILLDPWVMGKDYYAVSAGRKCGIFETWYAAFKFEGLNVRLKF